MNAGKTWRRALSLCLAVLLLCGGLPLAVSAAETAAPEDSVRALSQLVEEHFEDTFFSSMLLIAGETEAAIDGEALPLAQAPTIEQGQALLPEEAIAAVRELSEPGTVSAQRRAKKSALITQSEAEELGLQVAVDEEEGTILVTAPFQTRRLLVKTTGCALAETFGAATVLSLSENRFVLQYDTEQAAKDACLQLGSAPSVLYAEPDGVLTSAEMEIAGTVEAAALNWSAASVGATAFQAKLPANPPVITVAVLDTGLDIYHSFFQNRISDVRWNFVSNNGTPSDGQGHGTHVSGTVADCTAGNVKIMPLKVLNDKGEGTDILTMEAVRYAVDKGANVVNLSLSGSEANINSWNDTVSYAAQRGVTIVAATGNGEPQGRNVKHYPAAISGVIAVTASTSSNAPAGFAHYGSHADIGAPGEYIYSTYPGNRYATASGTSMATPHVSAAAALLLSYQPNMPTDAILPYLQATSAPWSTGTQLHGAGVLNLTPRTITPRGIILDEGQSADISSVFECPPVSYASASFVSGTPAIAAVTANGGIQALRPGSTAIAVNSAALNVSVPVKVRDNGGTAVTNPSVTIRGISMSALPAKTRYPQGEALNVAGGKLRVEYTDGVVGTVNLSAAMLRTVFDTTTYGAQTIAVELGGATTSFIATVYPPGIPENLTLTYKKDYFVFTNGGHPGIYWKSSKDKVLAVNADGSVKFNGQGKITIYTMMNQGGAEVVIAETKVTVKCTFWQWLAVIFLFGWIWM